MSVFNYDFNINKLMLGYLKDILMYISKNGLENGHHLCIKISTKHPRIEISRALKSMNKNTMILALQNQFTNLKVHDNYFTVDLNFGDVVESVSAPFDSVVCFADPSVDFIYNFPESQNIENRYGENNNIIDISNFIKNKK